MKVFRLSKRDRRALVVCVVVIVTMLTVGRGVPALLRWERNVRIASVEMQTEALRAQHSLSLLPDVLDSLEQRNARLQEMASAVFGGETPDAAASALASWISSIAVLSGSDLGAVYVQSDSSTNGVFTDVSVRGDLVTDVRGLTEFLFGVERGPQVLAFRELTVEQPEPAVGDDRMERLLVTFDIEGLALCSEKAGEER